MSEAEKKKPILVPYVTPELLEKNEQRQKRWANRFTFQVSTADEYSKRMIETNLEIIRTLVYQRRKLAPGEEKQNFLFRLRALRDETAEWLKNIGDFEKARAVAYTRSLKQLYREYQEAINLSDDKWCDHQRWIEISPTQFNQNVYREFDFYSFRHGRKVSMIRCLECGFRNARDLDSDLRKLSEHRANAVALTKDLSRADAAQKLAEANLHTTNLAQIVR